MNSVEFRKELLKIMPGYSWTVHKSIESDGSYMNATGIQSSGFNRLSTLRVMRRERNNIASYEVKSAGYGTRSPWLSSANGSTLARALRALQQFYEDMASKYQSHATYLQIGRGNNQIEQKMKEAP
jgi:hypothetical protein